MWSDLIAPLLQGQTSKANFKSSLTLAPCSRSNDGSLALVSCLSGGYRFASVLRCLGVVVYVM